MRILLRSVFLLFLSLGLAPFAFGQSRSVDLDAPGALEALARDNPRHHKRVSEILSEVHQRPYSEVPRWMRARFDARDVVYGPMLLVTHPPKRRLSFTIDEVRYRSTVTLTNWTPRPVPAR